MLGDTANFNLRHKEYNFMDLQKSSKLKQITIRKILKTVFLLTITLTLQSLIVRHDVPDEKFIELAKKYPQICHFQMGEGTLVDSCWILTAGHIGNDLNRDLESNKKPTVLCNGKKYYIDQVVVHPDFKSIDEGLNNDICLVKIKGNINGVLPAKIYSQNNEVGKHIILVGMGDVGTGKTGPQRSDKVTRAATNIIDGVENTWIHFAFDSPDSKNTTEYEGVSGPGDSGGPALTEVDNTLFIIGVSSFQKGQEKYGKGHYGVTEYYSRVSAYSKWIKQTMNSKTPITPITNQTEQIEKISEYTGDYGFRKIISKNSRLYFQRDQEPLIPMKEIGKDLFLWDDGNTNILFVRNNKNIIIGFEIKRRNGEIIKVDKTQ